MSKIGLIEEKLKSMGYKLTGQRRLIIEALEEKPLHYTAQEILEKAKQKNSSINFSTIYRNLELLCRLGIVNKLNISSGISHFELKDTQHHHHLICLCCGEMKKVDICPYSQLNTTELDKLGFVPVEHKFEIYGYCKKCSPSN
jgi:Fe2+ or Zn2+ uptake regulation protein